MKKISLILPILFFLGFTNVKAQENSSVTPKIETLPKKEKYALVISFISKGSGIDNDAYEKIDNFIKNYPKKPGINIIQKGREGEKAMYLKLDELSKKEKKQFIKEIEKLASGNDRIMIQKNFEVKTAKAKG